VLDTLIALFAAVFVTATVAFLTAYLVLKNKKLLT